MVLLCIFGIWANNTYDLIQKESFMKGKNWNPFEILGIEVPTIAKSGCNTPEVKQAYRKLARKYHPDMVRKLPESEQPTAKETF